MGRANPPLGYHSVFWPAGPPVSQRGRRDSSGRRLGTDLPVVTQMASVVLQWVKRVSMRKSLRGQVSRLQHFYPMVRAELGAAALRRGALRVAQGVSPKISGRSLAKALERYPAGHQERSTDLIKSQRIALIGPGPVGSDPNSLAGYETVARLGYTGEGSGPAQTGHRCDLNFLAKWHAEAIAASLHATRDPQVGGMLVLRGDVPERAEQTLTRAYATQRFDIRECNALFGRVVPNFAPQVIMWLLSRNPSELHISHIDLLTNPLRPRGYVSNKDTLATSHGWQYPQATMRRSFAQFHNPFTHFSFFKRLQQHPRVTFSEYLDDLMLRGLEAYRKRIQELYF